MSAERRSAGEGAGSASSPDRWVLVIALAAAAVACVRTWPGLAPGSLFLDDQWVAIALRDVGLVERLRLHLPMPVGFAALAGLPAAVVSDTHLALQLLPVASYLASVALFPLLVHRLTGSPWAAALGAALFVAAPLTPDFAVRVKHYTLDQLVTVGVLTVMVGLLRSDARRTLPSVALLVGGVLLSFSSVFLSVAAVGTAFPAAWLSRRWAPRRRSVTVAAGVFLAFAAAFFLLYVRRSSRPVMVEFWTGYFPAFGSPGGLMAFLLDRVSTFLLLAVPEWGAVLLLLLPAGLAWLWRSGRREYGLALLGFYAVVLLAALVRAYPMGTGRTDTYALAVTTLLATLGAVAALEAVSHDTARRALYGAAISILVGVSLIGQGAVYPVTDDRAVIDWTLDRLEPTDALVLSPYAVFALQVYGGRPGRMVPAEYYGHGFDIVPERPRTFTSAVGRWDVSSAEGVREELGRLTDFVATGPARLVYVETHGVTPGRGDVLSVVSSGGYALVERSNFGGLAEAYLFRRTEAAR